MEIKLKDWNPSRRYYKGWSKGSLIHLFYHDERGEKKVEIINGFPFYFLVDREDFKSQLKLFQYLQEKKLIKKYAAHPFDGDRKWIRVYINKNFERDDWFNTYLEPGEWNKLGNIEEFITKLEAKGIKTYEADLSPLHRFMCDYNINIEDNLKCMFYDLETDDTRGGFDDDSLKRNKILSYAFYDHTGKSGFSMTAQNTEQEERKLLERFFKEARNYDVLLAWNGSKFDFKVMRFRMSHHKIKTWNTFEHTIIHSDLLECTKRAMRNTSVLDSFSLANVGDKLLKLPKLKLDKKKVIEVYDTDKDLFKRYNMRDAEIMYRLEKEKHFFQNDVMLGSLGNRFSNYYNVSSQVEGAILKEANQRGIHYPTVYKTSMKEKYEGAYVKEPDLGLFKNVATFDFKSLYPSIVKTFNISHDTIVRPEDYEKYAPEDLITTPASEKTNCKFRKDIVGLVPALMNKLHETRVEFETLRDKEEYNSPKYNYYNLRIGVCKTLILSFYGEFGNNRSRFYVRDAARTITLSGQFYNKLTMATAKKMGYTPRYGDTDSVFLEIEEKNIPAFLAQAHLNYAKVVEKFNAIPDQIQLSYENYWKGIVFLAKKRYFGRLSLYKGKETDDAIVVKGIETRRSDSPMIVKNFQHALMKMIMDATPLPKIIKALEDEVYKIVNKKVTLQEIAVQQSVTKGFAEYAKPIMDKKTGQPKKRADGEAYSRSAPIHVRIAKRLSRKGKEFYVGSQVQYVVTSSDPIIDGVHVDDFNGEYDIKYYLNNKFLPPVTRILEVVFPDVEWSAYEI